MKRKLTRRAYVLDGFNLKPLDCFHLTEIEYHVFRLLSLGKPTCSVAHNLNLSQTGFDNAVSRLKAKLKMNRSRLTALAINTFPQEAA